MYISITYSTILSLFQSTKNSFKICPCFEGPCNSPCPRFSSSAAELRRVSTLFTIRIGCLSVATGIFRSSEPFLAKKGAKKVETREATYPGRVFKYHRHLCGLNGSKSMTEWKKTVHPSTIWRNVLGVMPANTLQIMWAASNGQGDNFAAFTVLLTQDLPSFATFHFHDLPLISHVTLSSVNGTMNAVKLSLRPLRQATLAVTCWLALLQEHFFR